MIVSLPSTRLGWYSVGLAATFVILFIINAAVFLPSPGVVPWREAMVSIVLLSCGIGGGIAALNALIRRHERSVLVRLALLPGLFVLFMIGEFLVPLFDQYGASEHGAQITVALASENTLIGGDLSAAIGLVLGVAAHLRGRVMRNGRKAKF